MMDSTNMGIADRDYSRATPTAGPGRPGSAGRGSRLGMLSVNTWLIIINVTVFVLGAFVFPAIEQAVKKPLFNRYTPAGTMVFKGVTSEQEARGQVNTSVLKPVPTMNGYFYHPIVDPQTVSRDSAGRVLVDLHTGQPLVAEIGGVRFIEQPLLTSLGHFSTGKAFLELQVWRFITFQFLHVNLMHLLFNMLGLWFVGWIVEEYLGRRLYLAFYLACGLFGAVGYLVLNFLGKIVFGGSTQLPALLVGDIYTPLVGASAGVFGVLLGAAFIAPRSIVDVFFVIPMQLRTAVYIFLVLAVGNLIVGGNNAGGDAAHVGGAIAGFLLIRRTHLLRDFFDFIGTKSKPKPRDTAEVDRVLDKVKAEGLGSLNEHERAILHAESARGQQAGRAS